MQRIKATEWRKQYYCPHGRPCEKWVQNQIRAGEIPGEKVGGIWFVFVQDNSLELDRGAAISNDPVEAAADALIKDWMGSNSESSAA